MNVKYRLLLGVHKRFDEVAATQVQTYAAFVGLAASDIAEAWEEDDYYLFQKSRKRTNTLAWYSVGEHGTMDLCGSNGPPNFLGFEVFLWDWEHAGEPCSVTIGRLRSVVDELLDHLAAAGINVPRGDIQLRASLMYDA